MIEVDCLVVGAGVAGVNAALAARAIDPEISIMLINGESVPPYKRTKLSKGLQEGYGPSSFALFPLEHYREQRIDLIHDWLTSHQLSSRVLQGRESYRYRKLVLACGSAYCIPPRWQSSLSVTLRSMADAQQLQRLAGQARRITVLGAGVEGLELAAAYAASHQVELIELGEQPLPQLASIPMQQQLRQRLQAAGVKFSPQETIVGVKMGQEELLLQRSGGRESSTDLLLLATGTSAQTPLLPQVSGKTFAAVDAQLRWSADVYLAGDLCNYQGRRCLLWHQAESQGQAAGRNAALDLRGEPLLTYPDRLYRTKLECFGLYLFLAQPSCLPAVQYQYHEGERYYQLWCEGGRLVGASMMGDPPRAQLLQQLIWQGCLLEQAEEQLQLQQAKKSA